MKRIIAAALSIAALTSLTACAAAGSSGQSSATSTCASTTPNTTANTAATSATQLPSGPGRITIGSANFPESQLLADIYGTAFEAKGVTVTYHEDIGARAVYMSALNQGEIGMVPEYTGALLDYLKGGGNSVTAPQQVYTALKAQAGCAGLTVTGYAPAEDSDTVTVNKQVAQHYGLHSIADLAPVAGKLAIGAPPAFQTTTYGTPALKKTYGVTFNRFVSLSPSGTITQTALAKGTVDAADIFSTDPSIAKYGFVSLSDPKHIFAAQNVVPLFRRDALSEPMATAADAVSARLTTPILAKLDARVANGTDPSTIAKTWVDSLNLH